MVRPQMLPFGWDRTGGFLDAENGRTCPSGSRQTFKGPNEQSAQRPLGGALVLCHRSRGPGLALSSLSWASEHNSEKPFWGPGLNWRSRCHTPCTPLGRTLSSDHFSLYAGTLRAAWGGLRISPSDAGMPRPRLLYALRVLYCHTCGARGCPGQPVVLGSLQG